MRLPSFEGSPHINHLLPNLLNLKYRIIQMYWCLFLAKARLWFTLEKTISGTMKLRNLSIYSNRFSTKNSTKIIDYLPFGLCASSKARWKGQIWGTNFAKSTYHLVWNLAIPPKNLWKKLWLLPTCFRWLADLRSVANSYQWQIELRVTNRSIWWTVWHKTKHDFA